MRNITYILLVLSLSLTMKASATKSDDTHHKREMLIIANLNSPPYSFRDKTGQSAGFNIDLIKKVMALLHQPYRIKLMSWADCIGTYNQGKADILIGMKYSKERARKYHFGPILSYVFVCSVVREDHHPVTTIETLRQCKKICIVNKTNLKDFLDSLNPPIHSTPLKTTGDCIRSVSEGYFDAVITYRPVAEFILKEKDLSHLNLYDVGMPPIEDRLVSNDKQLLNKIDNAIYTLKFNGYYDKIYGKWLSRSDGNISRYVYLGVIILALIAILMLAFNYLLHIKVHQANQIIKSKSDSLAIALSSSDIGVWGYDVAKDRFYNVEWDFFPKEGMTLHDALKIVHPDDHEVFISNIERKSKSPDSIMPRIYRIEDRENKGKWNYVEVRSESVFDDKGIITNIIGTYKDITEKHKMEMLLRESAERMDLAIHASEMALWEISANTLLTRCYNSPIAALNEKETGLHELFEYAHPEDRESLLPYAKIVTQGLDATINMNVRLKYPSDGKWHYCRITGKSFRRDEGNSRVRSYAGFSIDLTTLIETQHNLEKEKEKAQAADRLKTEFLANMSHEIRTPLNAIVGFTDVLRTIESQEEKETCFNLIDKNSTILLNLINDILDLSKIEAGAMEIKRERLNVSELFKTIYASLSKLAIKRENVDFFYEIPDDALTVLIDKRRIEQIITNFVTNAFKYTMEGHVCLKYQIEDNGIKIIVEDTGKGIPAEELESVFSRFEKLGSFEQGTGLGLSICKAIVEHCGGRIGAESTVGVGTTFWAWCPMS